MKHIPLPCPPAVRSLLIQFKKAAVGAYPVGGCVRDALMGIPPQDWDVAVTSVPEETLRLCEGWGYRVIPTGLQHGTVTVLTADGPVECTTCRTEGGYSDGRHPDGVSFTGKLTDDLSRRDFTVNAMAAELSENGETFEIIDLFGGQADLQNKVIRCVGDPHTRLTEDALRVMRGVRFAVKLGFDIHPNTMAALKDCGHGLERISRERISVEFQKILCSHHPEQGVSLLFDLGLMPHVLPCGISPDGPGKLSSLPVDFATRCACLLWQMPEAHLAENLRGLKLSNETAHAIRLLASGQLPSETSPLTARLLRKEYGDLALPLLIVASAHGTNPAELQELVKASIAAGDCVRIPELAIDGQTLMAHGVPKGKAVGEMLAALLSLVLENPEENTKERLIKEVQTRIS
ncbi:MAG: hypothetical protein E7661_09740 [Ruminococcaceae bacterium]|nr:hypothetical protein [Oscillospiraceae bacterium]